MKENVSIIGDSKRVTMRSQLYGVAEIAAFGCKTETPLLNYSIKAVKAVSRPNYENY